MSETDVGVGALDAGVTTVGGADPEFVTDEFAADARLVRDLAEAGRVVAALREKVAKLDAHLAATYRALDEALAVESELRERPEADNVRSTTDGLDGQ